MAAIERTAYPRFKKNLTRRELREIYTITTEENQFAHSMARGSIPVLSFLIMMKCFQRLGYFPRPKDIPATVISHVRTCLHLPNDTEPNFQTKALYRHQKAIREYLKVTPFGKIPLDIATTAIYKAAQVMDNPADLINVAIAELIKERCELPAFSTLDRLARRVRTVVNYRFFNTILNRLSTEERGKLDQLLNTSMQLQKSDYNYLKDLPKSPSISHMKDLQSRLSWLTTFIPIIDQLLEGVPNSKIKHFAAEAKVLDAAEMKDFAAPKRYTLVLCMIHRSQVTTRDNLVGMFLKRMGKIHKKGKEELALLREKHRSMTENLISVLQEVLEATDMGDNDTSVGKKVRELFIANGGVMALKSDCESISSYNGNNYLPLLEKFYRGHRKALYQLVRLLEIDSTTQDRSLVNALQILLENENRKVEHVPANIDLSFANEQWKNTICVGKNTDLFYRKRLEICIFSCLATELKTGDIGIKGSEEYADYREQLLSWEECKPMVADYCNELGFNSSSTGFVTQLKEWLTQTAETIDRHYPENGQVMINQNGKPTLKRLVRKEPSRSSKALENIIIQRLPERNVLDILCNVEHWTHWTRHFGPLSGSDPKLENPIERYIVTSFGYGCNLGSTQTSKHMRNTVTPHMISFVNRRHINVQKLDDAIRDILNHYNLFSLPKLWGSGKSAAADGTKYDLYEENLLSEYHIRYGGYGGIAYHHVSDTYIALFSHFIPCGVWEAVYIIDGLLKNKSEIQPNTLHADTQGQSTPVFALSYLLGINLMPRIRNWKDLTFFRPDRDACYNHIDPLFGDVIDWDLLETHWQDLLQVVLSIKSGKILPSTLLRKLSNDSKKNRLYKAFRELGRVVRTVFLLKYISDIKLREQITASTNKVEAYNGFSKWLFFGGDGVISENDPEEQEKRIKYNDLVANAVIFQNVVDITLILWSLIKEGYKFSREDLVMLSPYLTRHIKRFGDYVIDLQNIPQPVEENIPV
ncbi:MULTISPECIES: Tn3 family transposase [Bacillus]|uniref:Tn3 family transposase n=2 Tax=Bacillaceae TaxID=186817 RepID=UPI0003E299BD|nr:Tn3 family transposase [Bacillus cereus]ETT84591.1 transposase [Bacillus cereus]OOR39203.1 DDE transposase [Bacillus cereus]